MCLAVELRSELFDESIEGITNPLAWLDNRGCGGGELDLDEGDE